MACPPKKPHDSRYLHYVFSATDFSDVVTGSAQPQITVGHLNKKTVTITPDVTEQKAIAAVLGALDEKIELNRRMNPTLEAMARALFQSWFVDFDPVRAKLDGQPTGLDSATAALFPNEFEDSELGQIPKGWTIHLLGDLIELAYGKALKADNRQAGKIAVYGSNGLVGWHNERLVVGPGIVVGRKGNPGTVTWVHRDFFPIDTTFYVVPTARCSSLYFLNYALQTHDLPDLSADSAVPGLNRNHAYMSKQVLPPPSVLGAFDQLAAPLFNSIDVNERQSRTLAAIRDALLPRLLNGELRVNKNLSD
jgi:type I restriction enzyme S subunit